MPYHLYFHCIILFVALYASHIVPCSVDKTLKIRTWQGLTGKDKDKDKDWTHKDKDQTLKDKDKDKDFKLVLKDVLLKDKDKD